MALDNFNAFDLDYINSVLDNCVKFYESLQNQRLRPIFLYHQIRLLATISAWKEYYNDERAEEHFAFFGDVSVKDDILNCLSVDLEK